MDYKALMEDYLLSSGETQGLEDLQSRFHMTYGEEELEDGVWDFDQSKFILDTGNKSEMHQILMEKIQSIHNIPAYKYVIQFLMLRYMIYIGENEDALWNYIQEYGCEIKKCKEKEVKEFRQKLKFEASEKEPELESEDFAMLINILYYYTAKEYKQAHGKTLSVKTFQSILFNMSEEQLNDLALTMKMDLSTYRFMRKKVVHMRAANYYDRNYIFIVLTLKFGQVCQMTDYHEAFTILEELYSNVDIDHVDVEASQAIGKEFSEFINEDLELVKNRLFVERIPELTRVLEKVESSMQREFSVYVKKAYEKCKEDQRDDLLKYIEKIYFMTSNNAVKILISFAQKEELSANDQETLEKLIDKMSKTTSLKKVISYVEKMQKGMEEDQKIYQIFDAIADEAKRLKEIELYDYMLEIYESAKEESVEIAEQIALMIERSRKEYDIPRGTEALFMELWDRLFDNMIRYEHSLMELYNNDRNVINKQTIYRFLYGENFACKPNDMAKLAVEKDSEFYLDSMEFLESKINDNTFSQFPEDEKRQRNLILTLIFLNYIYDDAFDTEQNYEDTMDEFELDANKVLLDLGFVTFGPGNAYDAWISLLLSCNAPLELFRYIWFEKTRSQQ